MIPLVQVTLAILYHPWSLQLFQTRIWDRHRLFWRTDDRR